MEARILLLLVELNVLSKDQASKTETLEAKFWGDFSIVYHRLGSENWVGSFEMDEAKTWLLHTWKPYTLQCDRVRDSLVGWVLFCKGTFAFHT